MRTEPRDRFILRARDRGVITCIIMAARACLLLLFAGACAARECIELTLSERSLTDSLLNGTILKFAAKNDSNVDSARTNVLELWDRFPRILVPMNGTTEQCRRESRVFRDSLERLELWALKSNYVLFLI